MSMRHSDSDGSDIFWPGYVDAVSNLVLSLLFLLTIMTVAVFMFALELGRASQGGPGKTQVVSTKEDAKVVSKAIPDVVRENVELKLEIQRLNMKLAQQGISPPVPPVKTAKTEGLIKSVDVTSALPKPAAGVDKTLASDIELVVRFKDEAVAFTPAEYDRVRESLKPVVAGGKSTVYVEVPAGFSEAKRMGFYRAMAVRNLLIEMKLPKESINVSVIEKKSGANASLVKVRSR